MLRQLVKWYVLILGEHLLDLVGCITKDHSLIFLILSFSSASL